MLCDTDADPELNHNNPSKHIPVNSCVADPNNPTDGDYRRDNGGTVWFSNNRDNAVSNIMSYSDRGCRLEMTQMQRGLQYFYIVNRWSGFPSPSFNLNQPRFYSNNSVDVYENDNYWDASSIYNVANRQIFLNEIQHHTFHLAQGGDPSCDVDWLWVEVNVSNYYDLFTRSVNGEVDADTEINVYQVNSSTGALGSLFATNDNANGTDYSLISTFFSAGVYAIEVLNNSPTVAGHYEISFSNECLPYEADELEIIGDNIICTSSKTFSITSDPIPSGVSISWSVNPNSLFSNDFGFSSTFTTSATSSYSRGTGTISATISGSCGGVNVDGTYEKQVWVGKPSVSTISGATELTPGLQKFYSVSASGYATYYQWIIPSGCSYGHCWQVVSGQGTSSALIQAGKLGNNQRIECRVYNACGYHSEYLYVNVTNGGSCSSTLSLSPNPAKSSGDIIAQIAIPAPCDEPLLTLDSDDDVKQSRLLVRNLSGLTVYERRGVGRKAVINKNKLEPGIYVIDYDFKGNSYQDKLVVEP